MSRFLLLSLAAALAAAVLAAPATTAGNSLGPPGGTIYAFDQPYRTIATPTSLPERALPSTLGNSLGRRRPSYRRMRDAVSRGQPRATSLRACARSTRVSSAIIAARGRSNPRLTNWLRRQTRVLCPSAD
jgi:hypothetical protein